MNIEPTKPYVYKPFGIMERNDDRLYGVAGIPGYSAIRGMTKEVAEHVCDELNKNIHNINSVYEDLVRIAKVS